MLRILNLIFKRSTSLLIILLLGGKIFAQQTIIQYLSGTDKDHTVTWDFYINTGMKSGSWNKIQVPSNWEQQGFGTYNYYRDTENPNEQGKYKYNFKVPASNSNKNVFIVFEASMTETEVKINGQLAGPIHQGGFYRFKYNITKLLNFKGDNLLEVTVSKKSTNESVNQAERKADFWLFGGIFRPVYLEIVPQTYIDRIAINAKANGTLYLDAFTENLGDKNSMKAQVQKLNGEPVGLPFTVKTAAGQQKVSLQQQVKGILPWNPESPNLYNLSVTLNGPQGIVHQVKQRFGFRTTEMRLQDGFYVNDKKVIFKGVCRHSEWPESGRTLSKEISLMDVKLMKEMNMNAVRMSHYPPDQHFLDVCDSLGMFVLDELTGWQAKYDTEVGKKLVKELVVRDVNHPSIVLWDNGNEGGFNTDLDAEYPKYDPQQRWVIHPWEKFNGTDTKHYPDYNYVVNAVLYGKEVFFPTEFMHGLYDGGQGAGLEDFWDEMSKHPHFAGGFLWSFHDEGVARTDRNGQIDVQGNSAPDGILGPHREKEGSFYTIKEVWSPVQIGNKYIPEVFDGRLEIENKYIYTNLNKCTFKWKLVTLASPNDVNLQSKINASGNAVPINVEPGAKGFLHLNLPADRKNSNALYVTAIDQYNKEIFTWSWALKAPESAIKNYADKRSIKIDTTLQDGIFMVKADVLSYYFDTKTGFLQKVVTVKSTINLSEGPALAGVKNTLKKFNHYALGNDYYIVEAQYEGDLKFTVKWTFSSGKPAKLNYQYGQKGEFDFSGITFNFPEEQITGMKWEGRGPYRVWKNRLKGQQFGVWHKDYNNTITGESWIYPEFKGYHADVYWVTVENKQAPFTVYMDQKDMFFQMLKPGKPVGANNDNTNPPFPEGNLGFLNAISPIGTKFQPADKMGPQSQKNMQLNYSPVKGTLWFDFK
ncbi:glycoside hydrolase family 2 TIM barrel-domain containing protein [Mucilaginibacter arboris]|uniref:beta-galactosidase n=1 Tax=Mucilaginibacter arboris TaxID=2682090 RepID=A0A7K1T0I6_9SPHI|nr:glycoside hydrolase family 2 TIM barrel-domain containing protein [Mucilaginibacter arboris]MVN23074.1 glycoside hydrolase family 2 [Mucilaginibacter arboris]